MDEFVTKEDFMIIVTLLCFNLIAIAMGTKSLNSRIEKLEKRMEKLEKEEPNHD